MKTNMKKRAMAIVMISLLTIGSFAQQQDSNPGKAMETQKVQPRLMQNTAFAGMNDRDIIPPPPVPADFQQADELLPPVFIVPDLTPEQQAQIKKSDLKQMEAMTPLKNQMREKMARLNTALTTQPANMKEANALAEEIGQIHASILKLQISHDQELRNILTRDQQVIFDSRPKPFLRRGR
ncbi:MAG: hypothetical protein WCP32_12010 [Bacteroidota bacterium]